MFAILKLKSPRHTKEYVKLSLFQNQQIPGLAATISEIGYLLLSCRNMAESSTESFKQYQTLAKTGFIG